MTTEIVRKSTLALILALLISGAGKALLRSAHQPVHSNPTLEIADPSGGNPNPCEDGGCLVAIHLA